MAKRVANVFFRQDLQDEQDDARFYLVHHVNPVKMLGGIVFYQTQKQKQMKLFLGIIAVLISVTLISAQDPELLTLDNVPGAKRIVADEPIRETFSAEQAARYLDTASLNWQKTQKCATYPT